MEVLQLLQRRVEVEHQGERSQADHAADGEEEADVVGQPFHVDVKVATVDRRRLVGDLRLLADEGRQMDLVSCRAEKVFEAEALLEENSFAVAAAVVIVAVVVFVAAAAVVVVAVAVM